MKKQKILLLAYIILLTTIFSCSTNNEDNDDNNETTELLTSHLWHGNKMIAHYPQGHTDEEDISNYTMSFTKSGDFILNLHNGTWEYKEVNNDKTVILVRCSCYAREKEYNINLLTENYLRFTIYHPDGIVFKYYYEK